MYLMFTIWFEDIDKSKWSERTQWYLYRFHEKFVGNEEELEEVMKLGVIVPYRGPTQLRKFKTT